MNMNRKTLKMAACCMAATVVLTASPSAVFATEAPVAGMTNITASALQDTEASENTERDSEKKDSQKSSGAGITQQIAESMNTEEGAASESSEEEQPAEPSQNEQESESPQEEPGEEAPQEEQPDASSGEPQPVDIVGAGITQLIADSILDAEEEAEEEQRKETERKSVYDNIAIAQVDNFVNVRDAATEEGEVVGKLYNNSAATVEAEENGWYKITSGNVTGYVKSDFVVCGDENLAKQVSRRVATVDTETLFVRTEPTTESDVLEMVPDQEQLTVTDESVDGWTKVSVEKGDGYVSND